MAPVSAWYRKYGAWGARRPVSGCTSSEITKLCCSSTSRALRTAEAGRLLARTTSGNVCWPRAVSTLQTLCTKGQVGHEFPLQNSWFGRH